MRPLVSLAVHCHGRRGPLSAPESCLHAPIKILATTRVASRGPGGAAGERSQTDDQIAGFSGAGGAQTRARICGKPAS